MIGLLLKLPPSDPPPVPTVTEIFSRLRIATEAPSMVSKNYKDIQADPWQRIFDDRPDPDSLIPPMSLLYNGFGVFDDVFHGTGPVPQDSSICEVELWMKSRLLRVKWPSFTTREDNGVLSWTDALPGCLLRVRIEEMVGRQTGLFHAKSYQMVI